MLMPSSDNNPKEGVQCVEPNVRVSRGTLGLMSQVYGTSATVTNLAEASGGVSPGNLVQTD